MKSDYSQKDIPITELIKLSPLAAFGKEVRKRRKLWGMSQAGLARRAGTTQTEIARIEAGVANPTVRTMECIARGLSQDIAITFRLPFRRK